VPAGVRVIRLQNIGVGRFIDDDAAFITPEHFASLAKHLCLPGDLLIGTLGDPNLRACIQPTGIEKALNKADCVQMRVNPTVADALWVCWLLNMPGTLALATAMLHGQTRTRIAMGQLRELMVPVPPRRLQRAFAMSVKQIDAQRAVVQQALTTDHELFASLQSRAFRGDL
jgi:type I restriction enzyme S subunit